MITRGEYFKRNRYWILFWLFMVGAGICAGWMYRNGVDETWGVLSFCIAMAVVTLVAAIKAYRKLQETERRTNTKWK